MEFLLLFLVNLVMGIIFYLIIRLRLEKSAADYREKRLKREVDDLIRELNAVAERNISILENRIVIIRRLLEKAGKIRSIDINIGDNNETDSRDDIDRDLLLDEKKAANDPDLKRGDITRQRSPISARGDDRLEEYSIGKNIHGYLISLKDEFLASLRRAFSKCERYKHRLINFYKNRRSFFISKVGLKGFENCNYDFKSNKKERGANNKEKEVGILLGDGRSSDIRESLSVKSDTMGMEKVLDLNEVEISDLFMTSEDKYSLISELHDKGYPMNIISKCSGIPIGEVRLVLNLNSPA